jgi:hypothetical protein
MIFQMSIHKVVTESFHNTVTTLHLLKSNQTDTQNLFNGIHNKYFRV